MDQAPSEKLFHNQSDRYYSSGPRDNKKDWQGQRWSSGWQSRSDEWEDHRNPVYKGRKVFRGDEVDRTHSKAESQTDTKRKSWTNWGNKDEQWEDDQEKHRSRAPLHQQAQSYKSSQRATPYSRTYHGYDTYDGAPSATAASSSAPAPLPHTAREEDPLAELRTGSRSFARRG